jgi:hypothetical protein
MTAQNQKRTKRDCVVVKKSSWVMRLSGELENKAKARRTYSDQSEVAVEIPAVLIDESINLEFKLSDDEHSTECGFYRHLVQVSEQGEGVLDE